MLESLRLASNSVASASRRLGESPISSAARRPGPDQNKRMCHQIRRTVAYTVAETLMKLSRILLLALMVTPALCSAQDATARVFGTVYDQQGAVVSEVRITATNTATQLERSTTTDAAGYFQILALPIGDYTVRAEHVGFRSVTSAEQRLLINQALRLD